MQSKSVWFLIASLPLFVACGGSTNTETTAVTGAAETVQLSGTVPGTKIEAFCDNGKYYATHSQQNGTEKHPFSLEVERNSSCYIVMTMNENSDANRTITMLAFRDASGKVVPRLKATRHLNLGHVPLPKTPDDMNDSNGDHVSDTPLVLDAPDSDAIDPTPATAIDSDGNGVVDIYDDNDQNGVPDAYDDSDQNGKPDIEDDVDQDGVPDIVEQEIGDHTSDHNSEETSDDNNTSLDDTNTTNDEHHNGSIGGTSDNNATDAHDDTNATENTSQDSESGNTAADTNTTNGAQGDTSDNNATDTHDDTNTTDTDQNSGEENNTTDSHSTQVGDTNGTHSGSMDSNQSGNSRGGMGNGSSMGNGSGMGTPNSQTLQDFGYEPFSKPLAIPAIATFTIDNEGYKVYHLDINESSTEFFDGIATKTYGINSSILGQTIRLHNGDKVKLIYHNNLSEPTTMHGHGMHVPAAMDGGPVNKIQPGTTWTAQYTVKQDACTNWYHPHLMGKTAEHVYMGLAGFIIIDSNVSDAINLPKTYGVDDIPLAIQDKRFDADGQIDYSPNAMEIRSGYKSNILMINGVIFPYFEAPAKKVRFRVLNGSNGSVYTLKFSDNRDFEQIAVDNSFLEAPVPLSRLTLTPGERAEIVVDFGNDLGKTLSLIEESTGQEIMRINVSKEAASSSEVPAHLKQLVKEDPSQSVRTRKFVLNMARGSDGRMHMAINGKLMDINRIDEYVPKDQVEIWEITNMMGMTHNFHIHATHFFPLTRNGEPVPANERGYKDTIALPPRSTVRVVVKMSDYVDENTGYMYHCHFLEHEDDGMMGQFVVTDGTVKINVGGSSSPMGGTGGTPNGGTDNNGTQGGMMQGNQDANQTGNSTMGGNNQGGNQAGNSTMGGNNQGGNQTGNGNNQGGNQTGNNTMGGNNQGQNQDANQTGNNTMGGNNQGGNQTGNSTMGGNNQGQNQGGN